MSEYLTFGALENTLRKSRFVSFRIYPDTYLKIEYWFNRGVRRCAAPLFSTEIASPSSDELNQYSKCRNSNSHSYLHNLRQSLIAGDKHCAVTFLMAQVLRYGIRRNFGVISFLIVSTAEFCEKITKGLLESASNKKYHILVHRCESVGEVIAAYENLHVDFIVFAIDSRLYQCLEEVEKNIFLIDRVFVLYGHTCLVHGNRISVNAMGVTTDKILETCNKYNLRLLSANVFIPDECLYLGDMIINLASAVLGHKSGYPLMNTPRQYQRMSDANDTVE